MNDYERTVQAIKDLDCVVSKKEIRKEKGITLEQLLKMTGVSTSHINDIENNKKEPSLSIAIMLAKALKVNITEIYRVKN